MPAELNRLEKRAIEAAAVAPVIRAMAAEIGFERAEAILRRLNMEEAFARGRALAAAGGGNDIAALARDVATWGDGGILEMRLWEQTETTLFFDVTRCPYAELYERLGCGELCQAFSCCRDEPFARGLNPDLRLERGKTICQGHGLCDFRYYLAAPGQAQNP